MEKRQRTNTADSSPPSLQEAAASLDPLVQPIHDQDDEPVYMRRQSSIFFIPASTINENDKKKPNNIRRFFTYMERFSGILYALLASLLSTCLNFLLKQLNTNILDVLIIRSLVQGLISIGFIIYKGYRPFPNSHGLLLFIRSLFASGGSISFFYCLSLLPLPDLTTLRYTQVVWTAVLALIIFRERITLPTIIASILTLIGVVCVAQPTFIFPQSKMLNETFQTIVTPKNNQRLYGMLIALSCALSISMSTILNKILIQKKVRQSIIMFYFLLTAFIILLTSRTYYWVFLQSKQQEFNFKKNFLIKKFILACMITILQFIPMILGQKAIKREHPSIITVVHSSDIIFALTLQNIFTSIKTNLLAIIGSLLVLTSIFIVGTHKLWLDRQNRTCIPTSVQENVLKVETKK
jgi:drug/metabolite transporter (DMT)-like permease